MTPRPYHPAVTVRQLADALLALPVHYQQCLVCSIEEDHQVAIGLPVIRDCDFGPPIFPVVVLDGPLELELPEVPELSPDLELPPIPPMG